MRTTTKMALAVVLGAVLVGSSARAEEMVLGGESSTTHLVTPYGMSVALGGGVTSFFRQATRDVTGVGGSWDARVAFGTRTYLGGEAAYVGADRSITHDGLSSNAQLFNNGAEGVLRLNLPMVQRGTLVEPFVFGGVGWAHYSLYNADNTSPSVSNSANVGTVPVGAGLAFAYRGFIADARFTYRPAFNDGGLIKLPNGDHASLMSWNAGASVGYEF